MPGKRKTYYRLNDDNQIEKVRRVVPPDGWTTDRKSLEMKQRARASGLVRISNSSSEEEHPASSTVIHDTALEPKVIDKGFEQEEDVSALHAEIHKLKKEKEGLKAELRTWQQRGEKDAQIRRRLESEQLRRQHHELDRVSTFARNNNGVPEEEYYRIKNQLQGLHLQLERQKEGIEELRSMYNTATSKKNAIMTKLRRAVELAQSLSKQVESLTRLGLRISGEDASTQAYYELQEVRNKLNALNDKCQKQLHVIETSL